MSPAPFSFDLTFRLYRLTSLGSLAHSLLEGSRYSEGSSCPKTVWYEKSAHTSLWSELQPSLKGRYPAAVTSNSLEAQISSIGSRLLLFSLVAGRDLLAWRSRITSRSPSAVTNSLVRPVRTSSFTSPAIIK
jgi:hypothetical protein